MIDAARRLPHFAMCPSNPNEMVDDIDLVLSQTCDTDVQTLASSYLFLVLALRLLLETGYGTMMGTKRWTAPKDLCLSNMLHINSSTIRYLRRSGSPQRMQWRESTLLM